MKCLLLWFFLKLIMFEVCSADKHTYGVENLGGDTFFFKKVIDHKNDVLKNYTIIFKYVGPKMGALLSYVVIDVVNANSSGEIKVTNELKNIDATISIYNALNVTATVAMYGFGFSLRPLLTQWPFKKEDSASKSYTIVYMKNATIPIVDRQSTKNSIGKRQPGDRLIYFESRNVTNVSRFPSRSFELSGEDSITYVGFSFNSPTAMALLNTTFISEKEFSTVTYDMNTEHFVANISVYGYMYGSTPESYISLLGEGKS